MGGFAVGLERTYEFFLRVASKTHGLTHDAFNATWKLMSNQSERQFGAFCLLYAIAAGSAFDLPQRFVTLRNNVLHKGYIPSRKEVLYFASTVVRKVEEIVLVCKRLGLTHMSTVDEESWKELEAQVPAGTPFMWNAVGITELDPATELSEEPELDVILHALIRNFVGVTKVMPL